MEGGRRLEVMPERIELENRSSPTMVETEGEEISEELLNRVNLSLDEKLLTRSSSGSDAEIEQNRQHQDETSRAAWREALQLQLQRLEDAGEGKEEEEEDDEEDEEDEEGDEDGSSDLDSSDECHYSFRSMVSSTTGQDDDSLMEPDSTCADAHPSCISTPETLPYYKTPSTASLASTPDSTTSQACREVESLAPPRLGPALARVEDKSEARKRDGALLPALLPKSLHEPPTFRQLDGEVGGARLIWKRVLSERKKKKKRVKAVKEARGNNPVRATDTTRSISAMEESDLASSTVLKRCSMTPRDYLSVDIDLSSELQSVSVKEDSRQERRPVIKPEPQKAERLSSCSTVTLGVLVEPKEASSLSVVETIFQRGHESAGDHLDAKITRRVQRAARRQAKQEELKRLHKAQMIQRKLQQVEEKQRQLEERGVMVERTMRGEADFWGETTDVSDMDVHLGGLGRLESPVLMQQWFQLVQQKNALVRYESELMIFARELQLEDKQSRLQQELRERMAIDDHLKKEAELMAERLILEDMLDVVDQRNALVSLLEQQRLQSCQEDQDLEAVMVSRGLGLNWS